ncbi:hypothetical protein Tco_1123878 [Tanacetum coccineum]|uniref:Retrotransposon gag domain-containing protein n=1 Tax=Tanacetum coccineum TaxID=301880 RepID=A0ABQ5J4L5_9ASTR
MRPSTGPLNLIGGSIGRRRRIHPLGKYVITLYTNGKLHTRVTVLRMISEAELQALADLKSILHGLRSERFGIELFEYGVSTSIGYGVSSFLSNIAYLSQQINTAYPLPLDMAYRSSGTKAEIFDFRQFLKELRENTFRSSDNKDANEHIEKVLEIVDLFHVPNITVDQLMLRVFLISLTGATSHWLRNEPTGSIKTWEDLKTKFLNKYCPPGRTAKKMVEINNF